MSSEQVAEKTIPVQLRLRESIKQQLIQFQFQISIDMGRRVNMDEAIAFLLNQSLGKPLADRYKETVQTWAKDARIPCDRNPFDDEYYILENDVLNFIGKLLRREIVIKEAGE